MVEVYPRLLDAWVTEHVSLGTSRYEVRKKIEEQLDASRPAEERARGWGRSMTRAQWNSMKRRRSKRGGRGGDG